MTLDVLSIKLDCLNLLKMHSGAKMEKSVMNILWSVIILHTLLRTPQCEK